MRKNVTARKASGRRTARAKSAPADRSQRIRTYNFPQGRITDHRINLTLHKLDRIISGEDLDEIVDALIAEDRAARLAENAMTAATVASCLTEAAARFEVGRHRPAAA